MNDRPTLEQLAMIQDSTNVLIAGLFIFAIVMMIWFIGMLWAGAPKRAYWRSRRDLDSHHKKDF